MINLEEKKMGSLDYNDVPLKILKGRRVDKKLEFIVEWKKRKDGT